MIDAPSSAPARPLSVIDELLSLLICPESGAPLSGWDGESVSGALSTSDGRSYPVIDGIPNLLPDALRDDAGESETLSAEDAEKKSEMAARDAQADSYDKMMGLKLFTSVELPLTLRYLLPEPDHLMLEGGCGTGRMTSAFASAVRGLLCVDFSRESLRSARAKLSPELLAKTIFIQADLSKLPVASESLDRVGSFGVYEHIPTSAARAGALAHLARVMKPRSHGSRFALSAYRWGPPQSWMSEREGHHDGGIYFLRLTMPELRAHLAPHFDIRSGTEALLYYHLVWGRKKRG